MARQPRKRLTFLVRRPVARMLRGLFW